MYSNIAAYKFISISEKELPALCKELKQLGVKLSLKGTILLSTEGINLFLAGEGESINDFTCYLSSYPMFKDLFYKYSYSSYIPFKKLVVKIRQEIVTFNQNNIQPEEFTAPYIDPETLREWLKSQKEVVLLDTRNDFEYELGTFDQAIHLNIKNFRDFPEAIEKAQLNIEKPIVTFCTGGIRCEKAAAYLLQQGYKEVYQLHGGILNYFGQCGGDFYQGNCFVFDDRTTLNSKLEPEDNSASQA